MAEKYSGPCVGGIVDGQYFSGESDTQLFGICAEKPYGTFHVQKQRYNFDGRRWNPEELIEYTFQNEVA